MENGEDAFEVIGSIQAHQCKTMLCSELGQKQDLKLYRNYYEGIIRLS